jgi:hypothetical protein
VNSGPESTGRNARRDVIASQIARIFARSVGGGIAAGAGDALKRSRLTDSGLRLGKIGRRSQAPRRPAAFQGAGFLAARDFAGT